MVNGLDIILKNFDNLGDLRKFEKGKFELVNLPKMTIGKAVYEPGWKWSEDVSPLSYIKFCEVEHLGIVLSGSATVDFKDREVYTLNKGDIFYVFSRPHDSRVVGEENYINSFFRR